jgi:hypothetical protein
MEIRIVRNQYESAAGYTHGRLFIDECGFFCWTLEDEDRGLRQDMPLNQIKARKVYGKTAIPKGRYRVLMDRVSPKLKDRTYAKKYGGRLPRLENVPGWEGVLIHPFNLPSESYGCIAPGMLRDGIRGRIFDSTKAFYDLMDFYLEPARKRGEEIWLTIE